MTGTTTPSRRRASRVHGRLSRIQATLRRVRATEQLLAEQVAHLDDVADDAETRKLVSPTPLTDREWREARNDRDRHRIQLEESRHHAQELLAERDQLLDRLQELHISNPPEGPAQ